MNFGDMFNLLEGLYRAVDQDPMSFMVVYPMAIMTSSMLFYALIHDMVPIYKTKLAHTFVKRSRRTPRIVTAKRNFQSGNQISFSN